MSVRKLLQENQLLYTPGVWDALSALCARQAGFESVCLSGFALSTSLGVPDAELYSAADVFQAVSRVAQASGLPVVADIDTGYGNAATVTQTVRKIEASGATAFFMEDQVSPKRCPMTTPGPAETIPLAEAKGKVAAAGVAKAESSLLIARTDTQGDEALERMRAFLDVGADLVMGTTKTFGSVAEWRSVGEALGDRLVLTIVAGTWLAAEFDRSTLEACGVRIAILPTQGVLEAAANLLTSFERLQQDPGSSGAEIDSDSLHAMVGYDEIDDILRKYGPEGSGSA
jgi:methylisocitrate lyase